MLYAILGGIVAATIPFYCAAVILIVLHPTPTVPVAPSPTPGAIPSRQFPLPATSTPINPSIGTNTPTNTAYIPPTSTITPTPTETLTPTPPPTLTHTPLPTDTPSPTETPIAAYETTSP